MKPNDSATPYAGLTPDTILDALAALGMQPSGRFLALNSYENRVYQVELDDSQYVVVKFYRTGRWTDAMIMEEHGFALELAGQDVPVVPPLLIQETTLHQHAGFRYAVYTRRGGRTPELDDPEHLEQLGRVLGRIHAIGAVKNFVHRPLLNVANYGTVALTAIEQSGFLPDYLRQNYVDIVRRLLDEIAARFERVSAPVQRLHGDCHPGNMLWSGNGPHFVDLDDCCMGPILQDMWMLLSGERNDMAAQLRIILQGYEMFSEFDDGQLPLLESLRALRLIHYSGWLTRRWHDPAFPLHFPWFNTPRYWEEQLNIMREQFETLQHERPLKLSM